MDLVAGRSIVYQDFDPELSARLREIMSMESDEHLMICLPDVFTIFAGHLGMAQPLFPVLISTWKIRHRLRAILQSSSSYGRTRTS